METTDFGKIDRALMNADNLADIILRIWPGDMPDYLRDRIEHGKQCFEEAHSALWACREKAIQQQ